jgi:anion-transporting  ArsA/GET3 family ATPase
MELSFITGKGGVGKTRFSLLLAKQNKSAVLAETAHALEDEALKLNIKRSIHRYSRGDLAEEFLASTLKIKAVAHWLSKSQTFQTLLSLAPNLNEVLLLRKWMHLSEEAPLIIDAPSTGHFLAIFEAIKTAQLLFDGGSLRQIANEIDEFLKTKPIKVFVVSLPERSALAEMSEICEKLKLSYPQFQIKTVINRLHKEISKGLELPKELIALAGARLELEEKRIDSLEFDYRLFEGDRTL